jgi:hypothetical protein
MKLFLSFAFLSCALLAGNVVNAQKAKTAGSSGSDLTVNRATTRNIVSASGRQHTESETSFNITWKGAKAPKNIYYRPDAAHWLKCKATKSQKRPFGGGPNDYMMVEVNTNVATAKAGDNINLVPEEYPSDVQPTAVKSMSTGALFYQLLGSNTWQSVKVTITKLPDLKTP